MSGSFFKRALNAYQLLLVNHPLKTKAASNVFLLIVGDQITQNLIEKNKKIDLLRTCKIASMGLFIGPSLHYWYGFLNKNISSAVLKVVCDQTIYSPLFIPLLISYNALLNGEDVVTKVKNEFWTTMKVNFAIWIPFQFFNFKYVQKDFQVLASNTMGIAWNSFLSFNLSKSQKEKLLREK